MVGIRPPGRDGRASVAGGTPPPGSRSRRARPGSRLHHARRARARRWLAAVLAGVAVAVALSTLRPTVAAEAGLATVVALRPIAAGSVIEAADLEIQTRPEGHRPVSAASSTALVVGRRAAGPIEANGVVTSERLVGPGLLGAGDAPQDRLAMTVPVLKVALTGVRVGQQVDVYATGTGTRVVAEAQVLAVLGGDIGTSPGQGEAGAGDGNDLGARGLGAGGLGAGGLGAGGTWADGTQPAIMLGVRIPEAAALAEHLSALGAGESFVLALRPGR